MKTLRILVGSLVLTLFCIPFSVNAQTGGIGNIQVHDTAEETEQALETELGAVPQEDPVPELFPTIGGAPASGVSCFDYYTFGSVEARITSEIKSAVTGSPIPFSILVTNRNPYPITEGTLLVKVFREQEDVRTRVTQGNHLVDQVVVAKDISLAANDSKLYKFTWEAESALPSGEYYMATFFATADRYNLLGLSFTDDIIGNTSRFSIVGEQEGVYFDKSKVTINGEPHQFISAPPRVPASIPIDIQATIQNDSSVERRASVVWTVYRWDALREENKAEQTPAQLVTIPADGETTISYQVTDATYSVYLVVPRLIYQDAQSLLNIRFVREGVDVPRINYPGLTQYPVVSGEENTLFACLHNTGSNRIIEDAELKLTLSDGNGRRIHSYTYDGPITGAMMGVKDDFTSFRDASSLLLAAVLTVDGQVIEEVEIAYACDDINPLGCPDPGDLSLLELIPFPLITDTFAIGGGILILILLVLIVLPYIRKRQSTASQQTLKKQEQSKGQPVKTLDPGQNDDESISSEEPSR